METKRFSLKKTNTVANIGLAIMLIADAFLSYWMFSHEKTALGIVFLFFAIFTLFLLFLINKNREQTNNPYIEVGDDGVLFHECARLITDGRAGKAETLRCTWDEVVFVAEKGHRISLSDGRVYTDLQESATTDYSVVEATLFPKSFMHNYIYETAGATSLASSEEWKCIKDYHNKYQKAHKA